MGIENEHPPRANDSSQESESSNKGFHLHSVTTPPRMNFSSAEDGTCMGSSSARLLDGTWGEEEAKVGCQIAPLLVESYGAEETQVRKAALTCLVSLCLQVGEDHLAPHLAGLPGAKRKLLSLHLHRARTNQKGR